MVTVKRKPPFEPCDCSQFWSICGQLSPIFLIVAHFCRFQANFSQEIPRRLWQNQGWRIFCVCNVFVDDGSLGRLHEPLSHFQITVKTATQSALIFRSLLAFLGGGGKKLGKPTQKSKDFVSMLNPSNPSEGEKLIRGNMNRGNRPERLWEGNLPLRGSLRGSWRGSLRGSLRGRSLRGFQRFSEVFQKPSQSPSQSAIVLSELRVLLPLIVLPLKTPATWEGKEKRSKKQGNSLQRKKQGNPKKQGRLGQVSNGKSY